MKNTFKVHRNGGTKPASLQTKTPSAKSLEIIDAIDAMRSAKAESAAMHMLLVDVLTTKESGIYGEEIQLGITLLIIHTHEQLDRAVASVETILTCNAEVAS
jgi:hypothetical protein